HRVRQSIVTTALYVRGVALRALPQVHSARQGWIDEGEGRVAAVATRVDHRVRRRRSGQLERVDQGTQTACRRESRDHRERGESRLLHREVLSKAALSVGGSGYRHELGIPPAWCRGLSEI